MSENTNPEQTPAQPEKRTVVPEGYDQPLQSSQAGQQAPSWQPPAASYTTAPSYPQPGAPQDYQQQNVQQGYQQPGYPQQQQGYPQQQGYGIIPGVEQKSKLVAGILGILLGSLGIHNFYLGNNKIALIQLLVSVVSFGLLAPFMGIWGLIEGILILIGHENYRTDAKGIPLKE